MYRWRANLLLNTTMNITKNCRLGHEMHKINFLPTKGNACDALFFISSINSLILFYFQWKLRYMLKQICQFNFDPCLCSKCAWVRKQHSSFCTHSILKKYSNILPYRFCYCIVCSSIYDSWLSLWDLQTTDHCIFCPSIYNFWLRLWYLQTFRHCIVYSSNYVCDYPFGIFTRLFIALSVLKFTASDYPFGIFKHLAITCSALRVTDFWLPLWYLPIFDHCIVCSSIYRLLITPLASSNIWPLHFLPFNLPTADYPFGIFQSLTIVLYVLRFTASDYLFAIFKHLVIILSGLRFTASEYPFRIFKLLAIPLSPSIYSFWLPLWYFQTWSLYCLSFDLWLLLTLLISSNFSYHILWLAILLTITVWCLLERWHQWFYCWPLLFDRWASSMLL